MTTIELGSVYQDRITKRLGIAISVCQSLYEESSVLLSSLQIGSDGRRVEEWYPASRLKRDDTSGEDWGDSLPKGRTIHLTPTGV